MTHAYRFQGTILLLPCRASAHRTGNALFIRSTYVCRYITKSAGRCVARGRPRDQRQRNLWQRPARGVTPWPTLALPRCHRAPSRPAHRGSEMYVGIKVLLIQVNPPLRRVRFIACRWRVVGGRRRRNDAVIKKGRRQRRWSPDVYSDWRALRTSDCLDWYRAPPREWTAQRSCDNLGTLPCLLCCEVEWLGGALSSLFYRTSALSSLSCRAFYVGMSVRLSVPLSRAGTVSKRRKLGSRNLHRPVVQGL